MTEEHADPTPKPRSHRQIGSYWNTTAALSSNARGLVSARCLLRRSAASVNGSVSHMTSKVIYPGTDPISSLSGCCQYRQLWQAMAIELCRGIGGILLYLWPSRLGGTGPLPLLLRRSLLRDQLLNPQALRSMHVRDRGQEGAGSLVGEAREGICR